MYRLATMLLLASGCLAADGAGDEGIYISKAVAAPENCTFSSSEAEPFIGHGFIDVDSPSPYLLFPQMVSRITATSDTMIQRTIQIRGARVSLEFTDSAANAAVPASEKKFQSLFTGPLEPGGITDGIFEVIPEGALEALRGVVTAENDETQVVVGLTVFGDLAGDEVTSQEFRFPVTVCHNCTINVLGACGTPDVSYRLGNGCNPYQDGIVDCCTMGGSTVCPGF